MDYRSNQQWILLPHRSFYMETLLIPKQKLLDIEESKSSWLDMALYFFVTFTYADVVGHIQSVQGSALNNVTATTRVVVHFLIAPSSVFYLTHGSELAVIVVIDATIVTANKIDIVAYLTAIFDLIKLALVGNQAQSKLGEAERKAENLKNQAQEKLSLLSKQRGGWTEGFDEGKAIGEGNSVQFNGNEVHDFVSCGESHPESSEIYSLPDVLTGKPLL
ncbi:hypothetical protein Bca101_096381 [Brassica carinata]